MLVIIIIIIAIILPVYGRQNNAPQHPHNAYNLISISCYRIDWNMLQNMAL